MENVIHPEPVTLFGAIPAFRSNLVGSAGEITPVRLVNSKWMAETYPETFQRLPFEQILRIPQGMFVKVYCSWPLGDLPSERFWVEVTDVEETESGSFQYYGELRNDTMVGVFGDRIGPFISECLCDVDIEKFIEDQKNTVEEQ